MPVEMVYSGPVGNEDDSPEFCQPEVSVTAGTRAIPVATGGNTLGVALDTVVTEEFTGGFTLGCGDSFVAER